MTKRPPHDLILADIGGTNARFAMIAAPDADLRGIASYPADRFTSFEEALAAYLTKLNGEAPHAFAAGAAGPVRNGAIHLTNRKWTIDPAALSRRFQIDTAILANDLVAMAAGIALAPEAAFATLPGPQRAPRRSLVIAVGTGLGVAWYERRGKEVTVHSTESGHMGFSPTNEAEARFAERLLRTRNFLSFENLVSGSGIRLTYATLRQSGEPELASSEEVLTAAESKARASAVATLDLVTSALATFTRNLLHVMGGVDEIVYAGGLGRRLRGEIGKPQFLDRVRESQSSPLDFSQISVRVALDDSLPLRGAANLAYGLASIAGNDTGRS